MSSSVKEKQDGDRLEILFLKRPNQAQRDVHRSNTVHTTFNFNASIALVEIADKAVASVITFQSCKILSVSITNCCSVLLSDNP